MNTSRSATRSNTTQPPVCVALMGYGGLLPFLALAVQCAIDPDSGGLWRSILLGYGAVILSFVGALHWAFAMTLPELTDAKRTECYVWSVVPALIGWVAASIPIGLMWQWPQKTTLLESALMIVAFLVHYQQDRRLTRVASLPAWYLPLRLRLTFVAALCLAVGGWG